MIRKPFIVTVIIFLLFVTSCAKHEEIESLLPLTGEWNIEHYSRANNASGSMTTKYECKDAGTMFFYNNASSPLNDLSVYFNNISPSDTYVFVYFIGNNPQVAACLWSTEDKGKTLRLENLFGYLNMDIEKIKKNNYKLTYHTTYNSVDYVEEYTIKRVKA